MSPIDIIDRVRGTQTLGPAELDTRRQLSSTIQAVFQRYDFPRFEFPLLEHLDIYMNQMREEFRDRLFILEDRTGRPVCLQPTILTAAARMSIGKNKGVQARRLSYHSPVFRYESIRRGSLRQFVQLGIEHLLPRDPVAAMAEVLACAVDCTRRIGLKKIKLVLSDVGILHAVVDSLKISRATRTILLRHLMTPAEKIARYLPGIAEQKSDSRLTGQLRDALGKLTDDELVELSRVLLSTDAAVAAQGREPEEVAHRLVRKLRREGQSAAHQDAIKTLADLQKIKGPAAGCLKKLAQIGNRADPVVGARLESLKRLLDLLEAYGLPKKLIQLDFGLIRQYNAYSGFTFELHQEGVGPSRPIAGGGQYDAGWVSGSAEQLPGCGFAFGLERLMMAAAAEEILPAGKIELLDCAVITAGEVPEAVAIRTANLLRKAGLSVRLELPSRPLKKELSQASAEGTGFVVICGEKEYSQGRVLVRDMRTRQEEVLVPEKTPDWIRQRKEGSSE